MLLLPHISQMKLLQNSVPHTPCFRELFLGFVFFSHWTTVTTTFVHMTLGRAAFVSVRRVRLALLLRAAAVANQHPDTSRHVSNIQYSSLSISHCSKIKKGLLGFHACVFDRLSHQAASSSALTCASDVNKRL